jgi:hypothetical protein
MFEPGDVVECVDASPIGAPGPHFAKPCGLTVGALYTIDIFYPARQPARRLGFKWGIDCVELREVAHPDPRFAFPAGRFRLVKRRDADLIAKLMGAPVPKRVH